jgi:uncharacterized protein YegJ (DUF2314 family)
MGFLFRDPLAIVITGLMILIIGYLVFKKRRQREKPLIALVYLLETPRHLDQKTVATAARNAFGIDFSDDPNALNSIIITPPPPSAPNGKVQNFLIKMGDEVYLVNSFFGPYMDEPARFAAGIADKRLRMAIVSHKAWLSVDALREVREDNKTNAYRRIGKMMAEFASEDCIAIYCPELERCNEYDGTLLEKLRSAEPLALFDDSTFAPIIQVDSEDPRMVAAVAEARKRWSEFVAAFKMRKDKDEPFLIKAEFSQDDKSEFMWVSVTGIEGGNIQGVLENSPHELTNVKEGQPVEVPLSALNDWLCSNGEEGLGGFTLRAIQEIEKGRK